MMRSLFPADPKMALKMAVFVTSAILLLAISGSSSGSSLQHASGPRAENSSQKGGALKKFYPEDWRVAHEGSAKHVNHMNIKVESPQLYIMPTEIDYFAEEKSARLARQEQPQPISVTPALPYPQINQAPNGSKLLFDPTLLLNLSTTLAQGFDFSSAKNGLNITFNINTTSLTLTLTPLTETGFNIFDPLNVPIPLAGRTITVPINDAFALLNITGPVAKVVAGLLTSSSPLTWLLPPPLANLGGPYQNSYTTTSILESATVTSTSVLRVHLTDTVTSVTTTYTSPKVVYTTIVVPSTSLSTIGIPKYTTAAVLVTYTSKSTILVPIYTTIAAHSENQQETYHVPGHHSRI